MAERLHQRGDVDFELHYSGRAASKMAFVDRIAASPFAQRVRFHLDDGDPDQRLDAASVLRDPAPDLRLFVCGPTAYMDWLIAAAREQGWPDDRIHREYFAAAEIDTSADDAFEVQIASTGKVLTVPADRSVSDILSDAGIDVPISCGEGVCGTCVIRVIGGEIDHRDLFLMDDERASNEVFTPCVSRARSGRLVLDL
jgi:vanillate O-demethylase ferredoxin subunit